MHAGDWCNLVVSLASAYAAFSSAKSAKESNSAARESLSMQRNIEKSRLDEVAAAQKQSAMQRILDQLTYDARRANSFDVVERQVDPWNADSAANIIYSLDSAIAKINSWVDKYGEEEKSYLNIFLLDQLNYRVTKELGKDHTPRDLPSDKSLFPLWMNVNRFIRENKAAQ